MAGLWLRSAAPRHTPLRDTATLSSPIARPNIKRFNGRFNVTRIQRFGTPAAQRWARTRQAKASNPVRNHGREAAESSFFLTPTLLYTLQEPRHRVVGSGQPVLMCSLRPSSQEAVQSLHRSRTDGQGDGDRSVSHIAGLSPIR